MKIPPWAARLPILRTRVALEDARRALHDEQLRARDLANHAKALDRRLKSETRRRESLEQRLDQARARKAGKMVARALPPTARYVNVVSYPKSGRTWFSYLYLDYCGRHFGAAGLHHRNLRKPDWIWTPEFRQVLAEHAADGRFPVCQFTHLGRSQRSVFEPGRPGGPRPDLVPGLLERQTVLILRDPREVIVSHYHHLVAQGGVLEPECAMSDFIRGDWGIARLICFMNLWADAVRTRHPNLLLCHYAELRRDTARVFGDALAFLGADVDRDAVEYAVQETAFEKLKEGEERYRAAKGLSLDPDSFRFRRGQVGGYRRELPESDLDYLEHQIATALDPVFSAYRMPQREQPSHS